MAYFQLIAGLLLLFIGSESLIRGSISMSRYFKIPSMIVALTVVAFGTSAPELAININASIKDEAAITFGNVIGSNIADIFLVIGMAALIYPIKVPMAFRKLDLYFLLVGNGILYGMCFRAEILRFEGALLVMLLFSYFYIIVRDAIANIKITKNQEEELEEEAEKVNVLNAIMLIITGSILLAYGGNLLTDSAVVVARIWGVSDALIAVTIIALGSSAPELVTTVVASLKKESDIAIGGIVGSNLFNALGVLGISAFIRPVFIEPSFMMIDVHFVMLATLLLYFVLRFFKLINRYIGFIFISMYIIYIMMQLQFA